jgi:hypothetical protein
MEYRVLYHQTRKYWGVIEKPFRGPHWHGDRNVIDQPFRITNQHEWSTDIDAFYPGDAILANISLLKEKNVSFEDFTTEAYRIIYEGVRHFDKAHFGRSASKPIWWAYPIDPRAIEMITEPQVCWWNEGDSFLMLDVRDNYPYLALNYAHNAIEDYLRRNAK